MHVTLCHDSYQCMSHYGMIPMHVTLVAIIAILYYIICVSYFVRLRKLLTEKYLSMDAVHL